MGADCAYTGYAQPAFWYEWGRCAAVFCTFRCGIIPLCGMRLTARDHAERFTAELLSRDYFLSSPWKKESSKERRRRQIEIFLRSGVLGCSALDQLEVRN